jgi:hypothetical protein
MPTNEDLAKYAHDARSRWVKNLLSKCVARGGGPIEIPGSLSVHLVKQMNLEYTDLSDDEKKESRDESQRIMKIFIGDE